MCNHEAGGVNIVTCHDVTEVLINMETNQAQALFEESL